MSFWNILKKVGKFIWDNKDKIIGPFIDTLTSKLKEKPKNDTTIDWEINKSTKAEKPKAVNKPTETEKPKAVNKPTETEKPKAANKPTEMEESKGSTSEKEKIDHINKLLDTISKYQASMRAKADNREQSIASCYTQAYSALVRSLDDYGIDTTRIKDYINKKSKSFKHVMRDIINNCVSPNYYEFSKIIYNNNSSKADVDRYTGKVLDNADNTLLAMFEVAISDTNKYIEKSVDKFMSDKEITLTNMRTSLQNLTKDKESQSKELANMAREYATLLMVREEASQEIQECR